MPMTYRAIAVMEDNYILSGGTILRYFLGGIHNHVLTSMEIEIPDTRGLDSPEERREKPTAREILNKKKLLSNTINDLVCF
jgi:hypothetical protein